jgi:hypothetical protein
MLYLSYMNFTLALRTRISELPLGEPFCTAQLLDIGRRGTIDQALSRMAKRGELVRVARGAYICPTSNGEVQETDDLVEKTIRAISAAHGTDIQVCGQEALRRLGLASCNASQNLYLSSTTQRTLRICNRLVHVRKVSPRKVAMRSRPAGLAVTALWDLNKELAFQEKVTDIMKALPLEEQEAIRDSRAIFPGWLNAALLDETSTKPSTTAFELPEDNGHMGAWLSPTVPPHDQILSSPVDHDRLERRWTPGTVEGRWCGFGPYYAMFPVDFARQVVAKYCPLGGLIIDPFCGRGTVPFVAMATGRKAVGCDINPVAWLYAKVKTDPHPQTSDILVRANEVKDAILQSDCEAENEFQQYAWTSPVLGYLNAARRLLDWKESSVDRILMGTLLIHLHAKLGDGLSNQMRQSKSMAPIYSVNWWKAKNMLPPDIDILDFLKAKLDWRYAKGIAESKEDRPKIILQDARTAIAELAGDISADLIFTSPPYCGVTNYQYDNWIRLWLLGEGASLPGGDAKQRFSNKIDYQHLLNGAFTACSMRTKKNAAVYVRTDAREFTLQATISALTLAWPEKEAFFAYDGFKKATQTALFGDSSNKPGEVDLLLLPPGHACPDGFAALSAMEPPLRANN